VDLFYKFFIPAVLGGMIFFVLTDIYRRIINRVKGTKHA
jgi:predicted PurR-regulated permease PerM